MRWFAAVLTLAVAGCDLALGLEAIPEGGSGSSVDGSDGGVPPADDCSQISMLADDFSDGDLATLWQDRSGNVGEADQMVTLAFGDPSDTSAELGSQRYFDLRDGAFSIALLPIGLEPANHDQLLLFARSIDLVHQLAIQLDGTTLQFFQLDQASAVSVGSVPYDPDTQHYWKIANAGGVTTLEFSGDGAHYTTGVALPNLPWLTKVSVTVEIKHDPGGTNWSAFATNANGGTPRGSACSLATIDDAFDGTALGTAWARTIDPDHQITVHDGLVELAYPANTAATGTLELAQFHDMTNAPLVVEVPDATNLAKPGGPRFTVGAYPAAGGAAWFYVEAGTLSAVKSLAGDAPAIVNQAPYDATLQRWWRIRTSANQVFWEVSPDAKIWAPFGTTNDLAGFDRVDVSAAVTGTATAAGSVAIAHFGPPL